ncbi:vanadium-dependent haloperoxidase [Verrucosispora sp. CWR15]|uniref:Vanadium-dependent haloperoxidase n=1 Tax=Verrucosispora sioxanthis TaxID=2499994 RepID=A0A6M1KVT8_9ACTN|nr:vanadium-dependent haloperoxidase [Verrucosispora sioxanthis]NEE65028.1 vanadium-dependent haloperoxidase [Verrucosispora sioxanthis]NGM14138.1 vanadium-dependent haloperoxidase [Verrucosispora sioxanthis]
MTTRSTEPSLSPLVPGLSRRGLLIAAASTAAGTAGLLILPTKAEAATASPRHGSRPDVVGPWFDEMLATFAAAPTAGLPERMWAMSWIAAWAALSARRAAPVRAPGQRAVFEDAATATAVHGVLKALVPGQADKLDGVLADSLAGLAASEAKKAGIAAGREAAAAMVAVRTGDGLDLASVNVPFTLPPEAPGVYRLTPGATQTVAAGYGLARPFLLGRADRFRPPPPPALGTAPYRRALDEVRRLGGEVSERTEAQSDLAWLDPLSQYVPVLRLLVGDSARSRRSKVRLLAALGAVIVDSSIATFDAKYALLHWRPVTAIRDADTDGDPRTAPDPTWNSFLPTPPHPEYPSGHAVTAGAAEQVLSQLVGPCTPMAFSITFARGDGRVVTRNYRRGTPWSTLTKENIDARVLAGVHFRYSDEVGAALGRQVARYDLYLLARGGVGPVRVTW